MDEPRFAQPIPNVTVAVGRDANLPCVVEHLGAYKVCILYLYSLTVSNFVITQTHQIHSARSISIHVNTVASIQQYISYKHPFDLNCLTTRDEWRIKCTVKKFRCRLL